MSSIGNNGPQFHPGAPHVRIKPAVAPKDRSGREAEPFGSDFEQWLITGQWEQVSSSNVAAIAYDALQMMIKVRYLNGSQWSYWPYTQDEARGLYLTGSKGVWVNDYLKVRGKGNQGKHQRNAAPI